MVDPQASRFWQAALQSGLMNAEGLTACWARVAPAEDDAPDRVDRRLARQAVQSKLLTPWQAKNLLLGAPVGIKLIATYSWR